jgi:hypothetical protein
MDDEELRGRLVEIEGEVKKQGKVIQTLWVLLFIVLCYSCATIESNESRVEDLEARLEMRR